MKKEYLVWGLVIVLSLAAFALIKPMLKSAAEKTGMYDRADLENF